jgi:hypothetical protein
MKIRRLKVFAVFVAVLACSSLEAQLNFPSQGTFNFAGGILQPFVSSPQFDPTESEARQELAIDERLQGTRSAPAGGFGLIESWSF